MLQRLILAKAYLPDGLTCRIGHSWSFSHDWLVVPTRRDPLATNYLVLRHRLGWNDRKFRRTTEIDVG
jgi:hypothetical protein